MLEIIFRVPEGIGKLDDDRKGRQDMSIAPGLGETTRAASHHTGGGGRRELGGRQKGQHVQPRLLLLVVRSLLARRQRLGVTRLQRGEAALGRIIRLHPKGTAGGHVGRRRLVVGRWKRQRFYESGHAFDVGSNLRRPRRRCPATTAATATARRSQGRNQPTFVHQLFRLQPQQIGTVQFQHTTRRGRCWIVQAFEKGGIGGNPARFGFRQSVVVVVGREVGGLLVVVVVVVVDCHHGFVHHYVCSVCFSLLHFRFS